MIAGLQDASPARSVPLTLSAGVINDAVRAAGLQGDPLAPSGSTWAGNAVTNLRTNNGFETNTTGWTGLLSATLQRPHLISDGFQRADGAIGTADTGETWVQIAASGPAVLSTIVSHKLIAAIPSGGATTSSYNGIDLGASRKPVRLEALVSFGTGPSGGCAIGLISNANGLTSVTNITDGSLHLVFTDAKCDFAYFASGVYTVVSSYTYTTPCARDGTSVYPIAWTLRGSSVIATMPDGTTQTVTNANFATYAGRYCTFEHFFNSANSSGVFWSAAIDRVARFGTSCLAITTPGAATSEGVEATAISVTASNPYTDGVWVNAPSGATLRLQVAERLVADVSDITTTNTDFVGTGDWQSVAVSLTLGATSVVEHVRVLTVTSNQAIDILVDGSQLETGLIRNPYTPSSRIAARIQASASQLGAQVQAGCAAVVIRTGFASTLAAFQATALDLRNAANAQMVNIRNLTTGKWIGTIGATGFIEISSTWAVGDYVLLTIKWSSAGATGGFAVDGGNFSATSAGTITDFANLDLGNNASALTRSATSDMIWAFIGTGQISNADNTRLKNAFGKSGSPKPTMRTLLQLIPAAHPMFLFDGRGSTAQRRVAS